MTLNRFCEERWRVKTGKTIDSFSVNCPDVQSKVRRSYVKYPGDHSPCRTHTHTHTYTHTHTWWFWSPRLSSPSLSAQCTAELAKLNTKEARLCSCDARPASGDLHLSLCVCVCMCVCKCEWRYSREQWKKKWGREREKIIGEGEIQNGLGEKMS